MAVFPTGAINTRPAGGFSIDQSLRFNRSDSPSLSRTPSSTTNRKTHTISFWYKQSTLANSHGADFVFFSQGVDGNNFTQCLIQNGEQRVWSINRLARSYCRTNPVLRDVSAWYHFVFATDTTQSTASERIKIWINGERQDINGESGDYADIAQNFETYVNTTNTAYISTTSYGGGFIDGYLAEFHLVDGQQLDATDFGETDETYGHWKPIEYTGTYGTNGFYLNFSNSSDLGADSSGNGNNWTANNLSSTDVVLDSPTNNFCTWNPLSGQGTLSEGNLRLVGADNIIRRGTMAFPKTGKWYWEFCSIGVGDNFGAYGGVTSNTDENETGSTLYNTGDGGDTSMFSPTYYDDYTSTAPVVTHASSYSDWSSGDVCACAIDMDAGEIKWYLNNILIRTDTTVDTTVDLFPLGWFTVGISNPDVADNIANFGQDSSFAGQKTAQGNTDDNGIGDFYYTPPSGYLALCTANLSDPAVIPSENFNTVLYIGNGTSKSVTGVGFQPDLLITKRRDAASNFPIMDVLRGTSNAVFTNEGWAEETNYSHTLDTDGFTLGSEGDFNTSSGSYVAWNWKANGSGSSNTDGSLTVTTSANQDAGFSIVTYTGTGSATNYGHGLSQAPEMSFHFRRSSPTGNNYVWHKSLGAGGEIYLNSTGQGYPEYSSNLTPTLPTNTLFYIGPGGDQNGSGLNFVVYHFHSVEGFSKIGTYTGNADTTGSGAPFIYLGFKPKWWMHKRTDASGDGWWIYDGERNTYNPLSKLSIADRNNSEYSQSGSATPMDFVSNGVKIRNYSTDGSINGSGATYIYIAFAENPFKYTNAR